MKILVVAVGRLRPPFSDDVQHYQKLLARHAKLELVEVREDEHVARRVPDRTFVSLLDREMDEDHNRCVITLAEDWLRYGSAPDPSRRDDNFVARFLTSLTGRPCPDWLAHVAAYVVLWGSLAIAVSRLRAWPHGP